MIITFHKEHNGYYAEWFAYLPEYLEKGGSKADLAMVSGADTFLERFFDRLTYNPTLDKFELSIIFETTPQVGYEVLMKSSEDEFGAWYIDIKTGHILWLCPVTLFVFNEYPSFIYYRVR